MKKWLIFSIITVIIAQFLVGCSNNKNVGFKEFQKFKDKYISSRAIPIESPNKEKAVLYLHVSSKDSSVNMYSVKSIKLNNSTLTANLKRYSVADVDGKSGFNGTWKWVMLIEIDKTNLKENMEIVVKR